MSGAELVRVDVVDGLVVGEGLDEQARRLAELAIAGETRRSYRTGWGQFATWAEAQGRELLPAQPGTVALWAAQLAQLGRSLDTIRTRLAAVGAAHRTAGLPDPTRAEPVRLVMRGIRREQADRPRNRKPALRAVQLGALVGALPEGLRGHRDRALVLLAWRCALRRSEVAALDVVDVLVVEQGIEVTIRSSKANTSGLPEVIPVPYAARADLCPVRAWQRWRAELARLGLEQGPAFRRTLGRGPRARLGGRLSARSVWSIVVDGIERAGLPRGGWGAHSLRAGLATEAAAAGLPERAIQAITRHKRLETLRGYIREGERWTGVVAIL